MARFSVFLNQSPFTFDSHIQAIGFISRLPEGDSIDRVFFYQDATLAGLNNQQPIQGQPSICDLWQDAAKATGAPLQSCIANSLRRGVFNQEEASRYNTTANLADGFELSGLGEMADAIANSDAIIQFPTPCTENINHADADDIDLLILISTPPTLDLEPLELGMACAAFEQTVAFVFTGNGLQWLTPGQQAKRPGGKAPDKLIKALAMYDCDQLYVIEDASGVVEKASNAELIQPDQLKHLIARSKHQLYF